METTSHAQPVAEDLSRLGTIRHESTPRSAQFACDALRRDSVTLLREVDHEDADAIVHEVAERLDLAEQLEIQAGFADFRGHRKRANQYFMTVNSRSDYQFIPPHSEGTSAVGMQLAAFYCLENTTDGGASILMNVDSESPAWDRLREVVYRGISRGGPLTREAILRARAVYGLETTANALDPDDEVLAREDSGIPNLDVYRVLARPKPIRCRILDRDLFAYWDSIASHDFTSGEEFLGLLRASGLLRNADAQSSVETLDNAYQRRVWSSGVAYTALFKCKLTVKMAPGDLIILNNITWTHATSNWSPGSGVRQVIAAFA